MVKKKKDSEEANTIKAELGDNLFVLLMFSEFNGIDMTESFNETMEKFTQEIKIDSKEVNIKIYALFGFD